MGALPERFGAPMSASEITILKEFRRYQMKASEMLFFNSGQAKSHTRQFSHAMHSLIERGLVVQERHKNAYSLTTHGYLASLSAESGR